MATLQESLTGAVRRGFCQALPGVVTGALLFTALSASTVAGAAAGLVVAGGAAAIYGLGCNRPLPDDAFPSSPFSGGQCDDILYSVTGKVNTDQASGASAPFTFSGGAIGPVRGVQFGARAGNSQSIVIIGKPTSGTPSGLYNAGSVPYTSGVGTVTNAFITSVSRVDGQPDNCGNPPIVPPGGITQPDATVNDNITYINNEGDEVTIPVVLAFGYANVDINGQLTIPVAVQLDLNPTVNFNGDFNLKTGDFNVNLGDPDSPFGGNGSCGGDPVPDPGTPDPTLPLPPSDPATPSDPERPQKRRILRGCQVITTVLNGKQTEIDQGGNPDIYAPAIGYVNFLVQVGQKTAWTSDIPVKNVNQIIECPWIGGAIEARGTPSFNNQFTVYPIYTQQTFPARFPPES